MIQHATTAYKVPSTLLLMLWAGVAATMTGCASEGALQPPSLHIPANVQNLSAERFGDVVELHWTTPARTTDGVSLTLKHRSGAPFTAQVCRAETTSTSGPCTSLGTVPVEAGKPATFRETIAAPWSAGPVRAMHYRVRILNVKGRGADGTEVAVAAGNSPMPLAGLRAAPAAGGGVALRWQPLATSEADRVMLRVARNGSANPETLAVGLTMDDPGGANDAAAKTGETQGYTAFRTRSVKLGKETVVLNSAPAVVTVAKDALPPPPGAPSGFDAVVSTLGAPEIDLVWQAADEAGVVGYIVYRSDSAATPTPLTPKPIDAFSYADKAVHLGGRYRYRISAVTSSGVAGPMSAEIVRTVPAP